MMYEECIKHESRKKADDLAIMRNAYHAKEIKNLMKSLLSFDKDDSIATPDDFIKAFKGL